MELTKNENASSPEESLEQVGLRLKHWRETRVRGARIPEELWTAVAGLAGQVGVQRVAKVLYLDYVRLKKRVQCTGQDLVVHGEGLSKRLSEYFTGQPQRWQANRRRPAASGWQVPKPSG